MKFLSILAALPLALAAPLIQRRGAEVIPGKFIAVLKKDSTVNALDADSAASVLGTAPDSQFQIGDFKGMSFGASDDQVEAIRNNEHVSDETNCVRSLCLTGHRWPTSSPTPSSELRL